MYVMASLCRSRQRLNSCPTLPPIACYRHTMPSHGKAALGTVARPAASIAAETL